MLQVDLKSQLTIYTEKIAFRNAGSEPVTSVVLCQSQEHAAREAHLEVRRLPLQHPSPYIYCFKLLDGLLCR